MSDHVNWWYPALDSVSLGVWVATLADFLPPLAALLSIIWVGIRIWETKTVQDFVACYRAKRSGKHGNEG